MIGSVTSYLIAGCAFLAAGPVKQEIEREVEKTRGQPAAELHPSFDLPAVPDSWLENWGYK